MPTGFRDGKPELSGLLIHVARKISGALCCLTLKEQRSTDLHQLFFSLLLLATMLAAGQASEIARWEAADPPLETTMRLERSADSEWYLEKNDSVKVARLKPSNDYYSRAAYHLTLTSIATTKAWLVVEFLDRGYGSIAVSPRVSQIR